MSSSRLVEGVSLYHSKNSIVFRFLSPLVLEAAKKPKWRLTRITRRDAMTGRRLKSDIPTSASLSPRSVLYVASDASLCRFPRRGRPKSASPRFRSSLVNKNENFLSFSSTPRCTHKRKLSHTHTLIPPIFSPLLPFATQTNSPRRQNKQEVIADEIAIAFGRRHVYKLVDVLSLPKDELTGEERARALRYLLGLLSNQESKAEAVGCNTAAPVTALLGDENAEVRKLSCETLATLSHFAQGRASIVAVDAITAVNKLLRDTDAGVRDAAAGFMSAVSKATDGAAAFLAAAEGEVVGSIVEMLQDNGSSVAAKLRGIETLSNCTLTDEGIFASLEAGVPAALLESLGGEDARKSPDMRMTTARCLKNLCQHTYGKVQALEGGVIPALAPMLRSRESDIRLQAAGALMGLTLEHEAKVPVAEAARKDLVALLRDPSPFIAENALVAIQNCCEEPAAKKLVIEVMSERDQAFVFNPQVMA